MIAAPTVTDAAHSRRIPGVFQLLLALYILLTGDFPTVIQALAIGIPGGVGTEFAAAMLTSAVRDLLLLAAVIMLSNQPLGILHPLLLAVVVWPIVVRLPSVIEQYGGWGGILAGLPVQTPFFRGLPSYDPVTVWMAIAKYNVLEIIGLISTYFGYWFLSRKPYPVRRPGEYPDSSALRNVLIGLFGLSMVILLAYVYSRGGFGEHVTSLGGGRFRELAGDGPILVATDLGATALFLWVAARPGDVKSPLFLLCCVTVTISQFVSDGSRGAALAVPMVVGLIWSLRSRRVPWKVALVLLPLMFVFLGLLSAVRTASWSGATASEAWSTTSWAESVEVAQQEIAERRAVSAQVPIVARGFEVTDGPMFGQTYLAAVTALVPRAMWEDKPRGPGSLYAQKFLGEPRGGTTIPVSPVAEMFWNFGWSGVVILSFLYGALVHAAYRYLWRRYPDPFAVVLFVLFITTFRIATNSLVDLQQDLILLFICYIAAYVFVRKRQYAAVPDKRFSARPLRVRAQYQA